MMICQAKVKRILPTIIPIMILLLVASFILLPAQAAEPPQEIEDLQQWVYDQGYNYTVAENWITRLSPEEREALCGYRDLQAPEGPLPENVRFCSDVPTIENEYEGQPASYDAMALGYVTPIKMQVCGACWMFAATANFESDVAIGESSLLDFAEQELGDCNIWSSVGGHNFCNGGNSWMTTNFFTKYGSADETCHPYVATPGTCQGCPLLRNVDNWRMITDSNGETQITTIKNGILSYGPVYAAMYASDPGFDAYDSGVYEYWGPYPPEGPTDHAVQIIGWDDTLTHSHGSGAWMIKNSWGTSFGAAGPYPGCAWVAYGAANLGDFTNAISGYGNPPDTIFYHDECGWRGWSYGTSGPTAYGAVRFVPSQDETLTAVDFWAGDVNMGYEIKIFDTLTDLGGGNYSFSSQLGTTQSGTTSEQGYYSMPLSTPVSLTSGNDFIVQVRLTTSLGWPIPFDYCTAPWLPAWSSIATFSGESYYSTAGTQFEKPFSSSAGSYVDVGIRARAELPLEFGDAPDPTYPSLFTSDGARHNQTDTEILGLQSTGDAKDYELDANVPDLDLFDDGLQTTTITAGNPTETITFEVTDFIAPTSNLRVNILIDLNADGDWADAGEHVVQNQLIAPSALEQVVVSNSFSTVGATPGPTWLRLTLTRADILNLPWDGTMAGHAPTIPFEYGETEDWEITIVAPDLEITEKHEEWVSQPEGTYNINYTVKNVGTAAAGASTVRVDIDGVQEALVAVPILAPDESWPDTRGPYTLSGDTDTILVCADKDNVVVESNETNNCLENVWPYQITGTTGEVKCDILPEVTIEAFKGGDLKGSTTSDDFGDYTLPITEHGDYDIVASKTGYRNETQSISVSGGHTLDFRGEHGLIPNAPATPYVLACIGRWQYPVEPCELSTGKVLAVIGAWLYPIYL